MVQQIQWEAGNEPLLCYYSDIYRDNFPVNTRGRLWVIGFQETGVLPASFMSFALRQHPLHPLPSSIIKNYPAPKVKQSRRNGSGILRPQSCP